jgi:hypothetical protein
MNASTADKTQMNCDVVVDQGAGVEMIQRTDYRYDMDFGGGVIAKSTAVDERETFETAPCGIDSCVGCTDIWKEDVLDQECRSQYLDNTDLIQNATVEEMRRSDDRLMLLPVRVYAYALQARKWRAVCIDDISVLPPDENAFDNLVLPPEQKTLIEALVKNQIRQADFSGSGDNKSKAEKYHHGSMDIVRGKGRGLIILLHGVPGMYANPCSEYSCLTGFGRCGKDEHCRVRGLGAQTPTFPGDLWRSGDITRGCYKSFGGVLHPGTEVGLCPFAG